MSILALGLSHRTANLTTLERVSIPAPEVPKILHELQQAEHVSEVMAVSTCNRIEVYAVVETFHGGLDDVASVLARQAGMVPDELYDSFYVHYAGAAVEHLFNVTSGLDSMVVGETQILGQVRAAYATARDAGTVGRTLHELVQTTLRVGKRVHSETGLDQLGASVVSAALAEAEDAGGDLAGKRALVVGAGSMGALAASHLRKAGIGSVVVANRTQANAERLAASVTEQGVPATAVPLAELADAASGADVAVVCTGAKGTVLESRHVGPRTAPLVVCDLGLPRDVDAEVGGLDGVHLVDLDTVRRRMHDSGSGTTEKQTAKAAGIVLDEVRAYLAGQRSAAVTPTVTALRKRAAEVVDAELLRLDRRLPEIDADTREEVGRTVKRVVDKLLHAPTVRVKQLAAETSDTDYATALRELFELDPQAPKTVSSPSAPMTTTDQIDGDTP
ncbi:glutamyl-tRNA reductase [Prauserella alba]|uniref:Glutamyl-tRNA reductase n=1 Tax=Prauserella alba TaxID=176898 RepID=A0ABN1VD67_9PSEU|nr:glutamyl-tRNA reductase [Prauserella alba]MCP2182356.1 glutamyl-tRNA reductase [Prauserella alba]